MHSPDLQDKKVLILQTSLRLIKQNGLGHTTMDMVAAEAGISKKTLYLFFENKETLMMHSLDWDAEELKNECINLKEKNSSFADFWCRTLQLMGQRMFEYSPALVHEFLNRIPLKAWADTKKEELALLIAQEVEDGEKRQKIEVLLRAFITIIGRCITQEQYPITPQKMKEVVIPYYCRCVAQ